MVSATYSGREGNGGRTSRHVEGVRDQRDEIEDDEHDHPVAGITDQFPIDDAVHDQPPPLTMPETLVKATSTPYPSIPASAMVIMFGKLSWITRPVRYSEEPKLRRVLSGCQGGQQECRGFFREADTGEAKMTYLSGRHTNATRTALE